MLAWFVDTEQLCLPSFEHAPTFLPIPKLIVEVIFGTFIMAYINGIAAQKSYSEGRARIDEMELGEVCVSRRTTYWGEAIPGRRMRWTCYVMHTCIGWSTSWRLLSLYQNMRIEDCGWNVLGRVFDLFLHSVSPNRLSL